MDEISDISDVVSLTRLIVPAPVRSLRLFRGQKDATWEPLPSFLRSDRIQSELKRVVPQNGPEAFDHRNEGISRQEDRLLKAFYNEGRPYLSFDPKTEVERRVIAQHYGCPTRLLDWTASPFIGLYFAVSDLDFDGDSALWAQVPGNMDNVGFEPGVIDANSKHDWIGVVPPIIDQRVSAQQSYFSWHSLRATGESFDTLKKLEELKADHRVKKFVIPNKYREKIFFQLQSHGVHRASLFPGLATLGEKIAFEFFNTSRYRRYHKWQGDSLLKD